MRPNPVIRHSGDLQCGFSECQTPAGREELRPAGRGNLGCRFLSLLDRLQELQKVRVDFILMGRGEAMRPAWIVNFLSPLDELG